jgi:hypothetical protein
MNLLGLASNLILPISPSQVARITGVSHQGPASLFYYHYYYYYFTFGSLRQGLAMLPKLPLSSRSSCLHLLSAGITSVYHHTWPLYYSLWRSLPPASGNPKNEEQALWMLCNSVAIGDGGLKHMFFLTLLRGSCQNFSNPSSLLSSPGITPNTQLGFSIACEY